MVKMWGPGKRKGRNMDLVTEIKRENDGQDEEVNQLEEVV